MPIASDSEKILFVRIAEGDETAFGTLFTSSVPLLYPFIISLVKTEDDVREIIQETFLRVWLYREKLAEIDNPKGWLYTVASNECYNYLRRQARANKLSGNAPQPPVTIQDSSQKELELKDLKNSIAEAIELLPAQRKKIYLLSRNEGLKIDEIARQLNLSASTVKNALVFALKFIRQHLVKKGYLLPLLILLIKN